MKTNSTVQIIINALLFQCCWFLAIFTEWYWALIPLGLMVIHLSSVSQNKWKDLQLLGVIGFIGITIDTLYTVNGIYTFGNDLLLTERSVPVWLAILWTAFALTLNHSLNWLVKKGTWFVIGCAIAGPISYLAGRSSGVVSFADSSLVLMSFEWALIGLITLQLTQKKSKRSIIFREVAW